MPALSRVIEKAKKVTVRATRATLFTALIALCTIGAQSTELLISDAVYVGKRSKDARIDAFLGIPFAKAPLGQLRWQPPQPLQLSPGRYQAQSFKAACAQGPHMVEWYRGVIESFGGDPDSFPAPEFSEDCLYLNIWSPVATEPAHKPVVVYIHGGSNKGGWAYEPNYIGENLSRLGVVVVSVPYRLGVLGFFAHPELEDKNPGLLDQIAGLRWISQHIESAGGDPDNVTVMGESAGANNIDHLLASPLARGLFHRVIHQSGGWAVTSNEARSDAERLAIKLQHALLKEQNGGLDVLRAIPLAELQAAADNVFADHYFDPVVDGRSITTSVKDAVLEDKLAPVDLLIGSNADEWLMYLEESVSLNHYLSENFGSNPEKVTALLDILPAGLSERQAVDRLTTAQNFVCPSLKLAEHASGSGAQTWMYFFARQREGERAATMGAYHGAELPYVFDTHDDWLPTSTEDRKLGKHMMQYWVNFIRSGNPNGEGLPQWPAFTRNIKTTQILDVAISNTSHPNTELCDILGAR